MLCHTWWLMLKISQTISIRLWKRHCNYRSFLIKNNVNNITFWINPFLSGHYLICSFCAIIIWISIPYYLTDCHLNLPTTVTFGHIWQKSKAAKRTSENFNWFHCENSGPCTKMTLVWDWTYLHGLEIWHGFHTLQVNPSYPLKHTHSYELWPWNSQHINMYRVVTLKQSYTTRYVLIISQMFLEIEAQG